MKRRVIIAHGWNDGAYNGWINWLVGELEARGFEVVAPVFPHPHVPRLNLWLTTLQKAAGTLDQGTVLVGYSLGTPTILRFLHDYPGNVRIAGLVLVAGFGRGVGQRPGALFHTPLDFDRIARRARTRICVYSDNDYLISPQWSRELAQSLRAREIVVLGAAHFVGRRPLPGAVDRLPSVLEAVLSCYPPTRLERLRHWWRRIRA